MKKLIILINILVLFSCSKSDEGNEPDIIPEPTPVKNTAPTIPVKKFPANGLLCTDNPVEFSWNSSTDKDADAITYEIELSRNQTFTEIIEERTVSTLNVSVELEKGIEIYWRVRAKDNKEEFSSFSPIWSFYTEGEGVVNYIPFTPSLIYPVAFMKVDENPVMLEWTSDDVDGDIISYDIYFGETTPPILVKENSAESTYVVSVAPDKTYYWKIVVKDDSGGQSIGDIWQFKS